MSSEIQARADFSAIRYAQCWEDADILLEALNIQPGQICVSIASAGDNTLALLSRGPARVIAVDLNPAQIACLELRVAACRTLSYAEVLEVMGIAPSTRRAALYRRCRGHLTEAARCFWDARTQIIDSGVSGAGRFERYLTVFRKHVLPLIHPRRRIDMLFEFASPAQRQAFYESEWDTWAWRAMCRAFFSRFVMGRLGRDPGFFRYAKRSVATHILERSRHALVTLNPRENPYLQWILTGHFTNALPYWLRPENFATICAHLDRLEWRCETLEDCLESLEPGTVHCYNLSDIFEYMSAENYRGLLDKLIHAAADGCRLAYWNLLVPRRRPTTMASRLRPLDGLSTRLYARDKAFFYSDFVVEEVISC